MTNPVTSLLSTAFVPAALPASYLESLDEFLNGPDEPPDPIFPGLLYRSLIMLAPGHPRARKTLLGFELALAAATGTAPFGLVRFTPSASLDVLYVQEEDPRPLTKLRMRALVESRCGADWPVRLHLAIRRGVNLDDPLWVARIIDDLRARNVKLL